jgi:putative restriction endonuclease
MRLHVALTDWDWYRFLADHPELDQVNFWRPRSKDTFRALRPGEPLLFKLHAPRRAIAGMGLFQDFRRLHLSLMWDVFREGNGAPSFEVLLERLQRLAGGSAESDYEDVGCVVLRPAIMFPSAEWIAEPADWGRGIQQGKQYDTESEGGARLWAQVQERLTTTATVGASAAETSAVDFARREVLQRLGQGAFRLLVTTAYKNRCAFTGEHVLPTLEACHIRPAARGGSNALTNGLLLRADVHALFDAGYLGVHPRSTEIHVSPRLGYDFRNGVEYRKLEGRELWQPEARVERPSGLQLEWHFETVFRRAE